MNLPNKVRDKFPDQGTGQVWDIPEIPVTPIEDPLLDNRNIRLDVKRLDLIHPYISGNKWFKLKYNLQKAKAEAYSTILTFGGAYSNHIAATAAAAKLIGFQSIGIIRGEEVIPHNPILRFAIEHGMALHFISREEYRRKSDPEYPKALAEKFGRCYIVPEGGANYEGLLGCTEILSESDKSYDYICCACGTGTTLAGLVLAVKEEKPEFLGFSVLKGMDFQKEMDRYFEWMGRANKDHPNWEIIREYHFGGYAKKNADLERFVEWFSKEKQIPAEPVYTGKLFYGIFDLIEKNYFPKGSSILVMHTGGVFREGDLIENLNNPKD